MMVLCLAACGGLVLAYIVALVSSHQAAAKLVTLLRERSGTKTRNSSHRSPPHTTIELATLRDSGSRDSATTIESRDERSGSLMMAEMARCDDDDDDEEEGGQSSSNNKSSHKMFTNPLCKGMS